MPGNGRDSNGSATENGHRLRPLVLYPCPSELDGVSLQGEFLYNGLYQNGFETARCDRKADFEKKFMYKNFRPNAAIGIGFWGDAPHLIKHPLENGVTPVPWLNADGWVANYHGLINSLPLVFTTSNWVKETYIRDGVSGQNLVPMPIGIDSQQMSPIPKSDPRIQKMRELLGVKPDEKMILTIGGDTTSKGFQEMLNALGKINGEFKKWKYVGKSWEKKEPYYHYKEEARLARGFGFRKRIKYIDGPCSRETMRILLNSADIYAAPSRIEGFGMIQVEAMSCGIPVLSIDAMGVKDTIIHNETGLLAKVGATVDLEQEWVYKDMGFEKKQVIKFDNPKTFAVRADVDDLAKHLLSLLTDSGLRQRLGSKAREHVVNNFDYRKTSLDMAKVIEQKLQL
ncbi:Trehalose synthase [uncultured archaeon]|nr:Trehalose synthase [uncultured archaeon]